jgi:hypothetical protein
LPSRRFTCTVFQLPAAALPVRLLERVPLWKRRCRGQLPVRLLERVPSPDDCLTSALAAWTAPSVSSKAKPRGWDAHHRRSLRQAAAPHSSRNVFLTNAPRRLSLQAPMSST